MEAVRHVYSPRILHIPSHYLPGLLWSNLYEAKLWLRMAVQRAILVPAPGQEFADADVNLLDRNAARRRIEQEIFPLAKPFVVCVFQLFAGHAASPDAAIRRDGTRPDQGHSAFAGLGRGLVAF